MDKAFSGRKPILTCEESIDSVSVLRILAKAFPIHQSNASEIEYLYKYYKGCQPILGRTKERNAFINNKIVENRAYSIVNFKKGYLVGEPIQYISIDSEASANDGVADLNRLMLLSDKPAKDAELVEWQMICGVGERLVLPPNESSLAPFELYNVDPRNAFCVYKNDVTKEKVLGVYFVKDVNGTKTFSCYSKDWYWLIKNDTILEERANPLGFIPLIEYPANSARLGAFEVVLPLLDAINKVDSNRLDGVEQFVQSLLVLTNCDLPEETTANDIIQAGMLLLQSKGDAKSSVDIIAEQLDQSQTQVLKDDLYETVLEIVGMPSQGNGNTGDSSNNGAVVLKNGWQTAETSAKASEMLFTRSEREMLRIVLKLCKELGDIDVSLKDIAIKFTRRNYENLLSKAQVLTTMLGTDKIAPKLAFEHCGLFADAEEAARESEAYVKSLNEVNENAEEGNQPSANA